MPYDLRSYTYKGTEYIQVVNSKTKQIRATFKKPKNKNIKEIGREINNAGILQYVKTRTRKKKNLKIKESKKKTDTFSHVRYSARAELNFNRQKSISGQVFYGFSVEDAAAAKRSWFAAVRENFGVGYDIEIKPINQRTVYVRYEATQTTET